MARFSAVGLMNTSFNETYVIGGPCAACAHEQNEHGVVCDSEDCPDDAPMCMGCIGELDLKADAEPAFHAYELTPVTIA